MKRALIIATGVVFTSAAFLMGQQTAAPQSPAMGRGRGGAPYAWNDKNKDGICDLTGNPVGQGRAMGFARGGGGGWRGRCAGARGRGRAMGMGRGYWMQQQQTAPAPQQK